MTHQRAKALRKSMTDAERVLWYSLRNRRLGGFKFRRQKPIGAYIVDFVCIEKKLIIEVDGGQHKTNIEHDKKRSEYLTKNGYKIIRFWNNEVLKEKEAVLHQIMKSLK